MEVSLLHVFVLRQSCLQLASLLLLCGHGNLRPRKRGERLIAPLVELRQLWIERAYLTLDLAYFQIILLQRQQRFNFLLHPTSRWSSRSRPSELLEVVPSRRLQLLPNLILFRDQLVLLLARGQRNDAIQFRRPPIQVTGAQSREAVVDRPLRIDLVVAFGKNLLDGSYRVFVQMR